MRWGTRASACARNNDAPPLAVIAGEVSAAQAQHTLCGIHRARQRAQPGRKGLHKLALKARHSVGCSCVLCAACCGLWVAAAAPTGSPQHRHRHARLLAGSPCRSVTCRRYGSPMQLTPHPRPHAVASKPERVAPLGTNLLESAASVSVRGSTTRAVRALITRLVCGQRPRGSAASVKGPMARAIDDVGTAPLCSSWASRLYGTLTGAVKDNACTRPVCVGACQGRAG